MEEELNKYFTEYEKLLKTKDYNMLSDSERSIVSHFSTEEEYNRIRKIILLNSEMISADKKTIKPDTEILKNLIGVMRSNKASSGAFRIINNIFEYRIPVYPFAMYAAVSIIVFVFIFNREKIVTVQEPVYVCKTDTVVKYIERETNSNIQKPAQINYTKKDEQLTLNKETTPDNAQTANDKNPSMNNLEILGINVNIKEKIENSKPKGRTMLDDSAIVKFLVKI